MPHRFLPVLLFCLLPLMLTRGAFGAECILFADGFESPVNINHLPVINSTPGTPTSADHLYLYQIRAVDTDGDDLVFSLLQGPAGMALSVSTGQLSWLPDATAIGSHPVQIQVSDGRGGCAVQSYSLGVIADAANQPPLAQAGADQTLSEGALALLDGSASTDADGYIAAWRWEQISGPAAQLIDNFTAKAQVVTPPVGVDTVLEFRLTVTDNRNAEATDTLQLTITPDFSDGDIDGDMIPDADDAFPNDPSDAYDYDNDGVGDNVDDDRDGDGVVNVNDFYPDDPALNAAPQLSIDTPLNNANIASDRVLVTGTLNGPWNTGILVNNRLALRGGNPWGSEFALRIPLQNGTNSIEVVATGQSGKQVSQTLTVTRTGSPPFQLDAAPRIAFAPGEILFAPAIPAGLNIQQADWDFDGDGSPELTLTGNFNQPISHSYAVAGLYYPQLTLTDDQSQTYRQTLAISIVDQNAHDTRLKSLWNAMTQALADQNLGLAQSFLMGEPDSGYGKVYYLLLPHMPTIIPGFSLPETVETALSYAEYAVGESINGESRVFLVQLLQDALGVWRVDGM